jgi:hypothetical protein
MFNKIYLEINIYPVLSTGVNIGLKNIVMADGKYMKRLMNGMSRMQNYLTLFSCGRIFQYSLSDAQAAVDKMIDGRNKKEPKIIGRMTEEQFINSLV